MKSINIQSISSISEIDDGDILQYQGHKQFYEVMGFNTVTGDCIIRMLLPTQSGRNHGNSFDLSIDRIIKGFYKVLSKDNSKLKIGVSFILLCFYYGLETELNQILVEVGL